ncbi:hypothetical protein MSAN_02135900 [Mycena sanguinolenta]|uniref:Uncharacterized protein n=1 Tax=Mycena sanguinolenta TaxID=230812 RepID=A0A8H6XHU7_9AGAR|nr:hypothetical protein MSAN_02135900 [Mycena sanguinolenta]
MHSHLAIPSLARYAYLLPLYLSSHRASHSRCSPSLRAPLALLPLALFPVCPFFLSPALPALPPSLPPSPLAFFNYWSHPFSVRASGTGTTKATCSSSGSGASPSTTE